MTSARRHLSAFAALALTAMVLPLSATSVAAESGATVPSGFRDELVWGSLPDHPMAVSFAPSGKVFVAFKGGVINEYDSLTDTSGQEAQLKTGANVEVAIKATPESIGL